jgi:cation diffusion facilitator CzcD-associated flavoprotein CzcO
MAVDTPAKIAILGAGPIGLEAALYARFLGYDVDIFERGRPAEHVRRWGRVPLFSTWSNLVSPLGLRALAAQDPTFHPPDLTARPTADEWLARYLQPLAESDLLVDSLRLEVEVVAVGREGILKGDLLGDEARLEFPFRLLLQKRDGGQWTAAADIVFDCTGTQAQPNWLGAGGIPACGEQTLRASFDFGLLDLMGDDRERFAGRRVLVVGAGASAATNIVALAELARTTPATHIAWVTRREAEPLGPVRQRPDDPLPARARLAAAANRLALEGDAVRHLPGSQVDALRRADDGRAFVVRLTGEQTLELEVDRIVANVGYRGCRSLYEELQVDEPADGSGPRKYLAAASRDAEVIPDLDAPPRQEGTKGEGREPRAGEERAAPLVVHTEPDFYVLGAKARGRRGDFLFADGLNEIRDLFRLIGDRAELDLYQTHS